MREAQTIRWDPVPLGPDRDHKERFLYTVVSGASSWASATLYLCQQGLKDGQMDLRGHNTLIY